VTRATCDEWAGPRADSPSGRPGLRTASPGRPKERFRRR
jgi:hypothetical protein